MIRLITSSTTDTSFVLGKSDGIDQPNAIYFDKVKNNKVYVIIMVHFFFIRLNNRERFIYTVELGEVEKKKNPIH